MLCKATLQSNFFHFFLYWTRDYVILCTAENLSIDEQDCGLDFFASADGRYPHRLKKDRKNTDARRLSRSCGIAIF
jgi:hypothetical protein